MLENGRYILPLQEVPDSFCLILSVQESDWTNIAAYQG